MNLTRLKRDWTDKTVLNDFLKKKLDVACMIPKFKIEVQVLDEGRRMFRGGWKPLGA